VCFLLDGNWTYEPAGLLDQDHVRFFTRREIEKLFYRAGFAISQMQGLLGPGDEQVRQSEPPGEVRAGRLHIGGLSPEEADEFYVYQYLISVRPAAHGAEGAECQGQPIAANGHTGPSLTSIVIPTHNQLAYTRECLASIRQRTDEPYELIVVDNGSTDGTVEYLHSLAGVTVISNPENRGFPVAVNQGIRAARGRHLLLLNNDCIVTTGWLGRLLRALGSDPRIGLVGPVSNCVSGEQQIDVRYEGDLTGLDTARRDASMKGLQ